MKNGLDQAITAEWYIADVIVSGDVNSLINGFDVITDVVRYSNPINNVTAAKSFERLDVGNLYCRNGCTLMDVDVYDWMNKVVFVGGNYTIQGTTVIEAPVIYNSVK